MLEDGTVENLQEGVFRTNCIDCLDRTNVVQSLFARLCLQDQLLVNTSLSIFLFDNLSRYIHIKKISMYLTVSIHYFYFRDWGSYRKDRSLKIRQTLNTSLKMVKLEDNVHLYL